MNTGGHFVAILLWHACIHLTSMMHGIRSTKQQQFIKYNPGLLTNLNVVNCILHGSYAYYFLNHVTHIAIAM